MVSRNRNQDLVNGNREGARVVSPNFDLTEGIPIDVIHQTNSSQVQVQVQKLLRR